MQDSRKMFRQDSFRWLPGNGTYHDAFSPRLGICLYSSLLIGIYFVELKQRLN